MADFVLQNKDIIELQRHVFGSSVDRSCVKKLVQQLFRHCRCRDIHHWAGGFHGNQDACDEVDSLSSPQTATDPDTHVAPVCRTHERTLSIQDTVNQLDVKEEGIATLLSYIENHSAGLLENLGIVYSTCRLQCYLGQKQLHALAAKHPPIALALARKKKNPQHGESSDAGASNAVTFDLVEVSDALGFDSWMVKKEMKALQWTSTPTGWKKTGIMADFQDLSFHLRVRGDLTAVEMDDAMDAVWVKVQARERDQLGSLRKLAEALKSVSYKSYWMCSDAMDVQRSDQLKGHLVDYFQKDHADPHTPNMDSDDQMEPDNSTLHQLRQDIGHFLSVYGHDHQWTGRAIARVFHGIPSPCFPADVWGRVRRFWRCHLDVAFHLVLREAQDLLIAYR